MPEECNHHCEGCSVENCGSRIERLKPHEGTKIGKTIAVCSGKGGVGKSLVTSLLAVSLMNEGKKVAILDADVTGPSIPQAFGFKGYVASGTEEGIFPALSKRGAAIMSANLLVDDPATPIIWRGSLLSSFVGQLYTDVMYGNVDVLLIDMPPGTGDIPLTIFQQIPVDGVVVVSTPQDLVSLIVEKAVNMARMMDIPLLGLVENMSYVKCPGCGEKVYPFGKGESEQAAKKYGLPLLAELPIEEKTRLLVDEGRIEEYQGDDLKGVIEAIQKLGQ